jgi:serine/threonine-protein kinase
VIGATLDKYEVLQKLGEGGMATVYLGRHGTLNRSVAIKVLHPHLSSSARNRRRFAAEARAIERLRHPNILEIYDYSGIESSDCYIVTEYVLGVTLADLVRDRGRLPSELVCLIGLEIAEALGYAHRAGILHRDIKPENVMMRPDGAVKLMDFGIARFLDESHVTMTGALVGSPAFMSPEQATEANVDQRSDLFSLGTLLFYLVTGSLPFSGSNPSVILKNVIEGNRPNTLELAPGCSAMLADVIERCMSPRPDDRFSRAEDVADGLRAALAEVGEEAEVPRQHIGTWLTDADGWERALDGRLRVALLERGRAQMAAGEALVALRLFNRLLAIDEGNAEVLALVQNLHRPNRSLRPRRAIWGVVGVLTLGAMGAVAWFTVEQAAPPVQPPVSMGAVAPTPKPPPPPAPVVEPTVVALEVPTRSAAPLAPTTPAIRSPEAPAPPLPSPLPSSIAPAHVRFVTPFAAQILREGRVLGDVRQRDAFELPAGHHELEARGDAVETLVFTVDLVEGSETEMDLPLVPRPARVRIDATWPEDCTVRLDGVDAGTVASLPLGHGPDGTPVRVLGVRGPLDPHEVTLTCAGTSTSRRWERFTSVDVAFPTRP